MGYITIGDRRVEAPEIKGVMQTSQILSDIADDCYTNLYRANLVNTIGNFGPALEPLMPEIYKIRYLNSGMPGVVTLALDALIARYEHATKDKTKKVTRATLMEVKDADFS